MLRTSFEHTAGAGEDLDLKHLAWIVENLQEELLRANTARQSADAAVAHLQAEASALQVTIAGWLAAHEACRTSTKPESACWLASVCRVTRCRESRRLPWWGCEAFVHSEAVPLHGVSVYATSLRMPSTRPDLQA